MKQVGATQPRDAAFVRGVGATLYEKVVELDNLKVLHVASP